MMMGDLLIEDAAKGAGLAKDEFQKKEVAARLKPITDADIQQFYEENRERAQGRTDRSARRTDPRISHRAAAAAGARAARRRPHEEVRRSRPARPAASDGRRLGRTIRSSGPATAPITIVEFSDYQCPFCARVNPTLDRSCARPTATRFAIVFKDFPLPNHAEAPKAAEAAHCAGEQGKYWEMHDRLFANQQALRPARAQAGTRPRSASTRPSSTSASTRGSTRRAIADNMKPGESAGRAVDADRSTSTAGRSSARSRSSSSRW